MKNELKEENAYKTIGEAAKEIDLIDKKTGQLQTHTLRYWEKQFKQIRPYIRAGGRRYYSKKNIKLINYIKYLLKDKGLTINGVKKILNRSEPVSIDDTINNDIYNADKKSAKFIKEKVKNISKIIKDLKKIKDG